MRFTTYTKYQGSLLDALNIQELLDRLADFLLQSGFAGRPEDQPWWADPLDMDEASRSLEALKQALLRALIESGQLTPEMLAELRGEGQSDEEQRARVEQLLDDLVERLVEEGHLTFRPAAPGEPTHTRVPGAGKLDADAEAARLLEFQLTEKGLKFLGYRASEQR